MTKPLFPGYVFAKLDKTKRDIVLKSKNVVRIIEVKDQRRIAKELDQIQMALAADPTLGASESFTKGKYVRITDGPFRGLEGIVQSVRGETRVVLNVDMIGQGVPVEVEMHMVEPADV